MFCIIKCSHTHVHTSTHSLSLSLFEKHLNKLRLYPFTNQEITKTLQTIDLYQFCLFFENLQKKKKY